MKFEKISDSISTSIDRINRELDGIPRGAYQVWRENTPRRTGNARNKTYLRQDNIVTTYGYAVPLDRGSSSKNPRGMSQPTLAWLRQRLRSILRK